MEAMRSRDSLAMGRASPERSTFASFERSRTALAAMLRAGCDVLLCGRLFRRRRGLGVAAWLVLLSCSGCTTFSEYVHNGFKVGPNYQRPAAPVAHRLDR